MSGKSAAFFDYSEILHAPLTPQQRARPSRLQPKNPHPEPKLRRIAAANDRLCVAEPRAFGARPKESRHGHRSGPHDVNEDRGN
jgi:hypothetical protein